MIAVIGGDKPPADALALAEEVGREIARGGHTLVCGGRSGVSEAACRGAREAGGHTIGILPGPDRRDANEHVEFAVVTNMGHARNTLIVLSADAVIAVDGSYGTLSEIAMALVHGKPVVGLATWHISETPGMDDPRIDRCDDAAEAVRHAVAAASTGARA